MLLVFKNSVRTSKRTPHFTITKINWLMLFKEITAVYDENHTKPINTKQRTDCLRWLEPRLFLDGTRRKAVPEIISQNDPRQNSLPDPFPLSSIQLTPFPLR
jgi:hypothetical protein